MSAAVFSDDEWRQLGGTSDSLLTVTSAEVQDPEKLARMLQTALRELAELRREWRPRVRYWRDVTVDGTAATQCRFEHNLGGRVNWHAVGAESTVDLWQHEDTDDNVLILVSNAPATVTVRIEEAG